MQTNNSTPNYHIRVKGHLDQRWMRWFEGLEVTLDSNGETLLRARQLDNAALYGILNRIRDLGLELISVHRFESDQSPLDTQNEV